MTGTQPTSPNFFRNRCFMIMKETKSMRRPLMTSLMSRLTAQQHDGLGSIWELRDWQYSRRAKYRALKAVLRANLQQMRQIRSSQSLLFSIKHFAFFARKALQHTALTVHHPFNFVSVSRFDNHINGLSYHLRTFFDLACRAKLSFNDMAFYVASCLLMDAYPPGMHRFESHMIFESLYRPACMQALETLQTDVYRPLSERCQAVASFLKGFSDQLSERSAV